VLELRARVNGFFERDYDSYGRRLEDERSRDSTYWLHVNSQSRSQIYEHSPGNLAKKYFDSPKGRVCDEENARTSEYTGVMHHTDICRLHPAWLDLAVQPFVA